MNTKYIWLLLIFIGFTACEDDDNSTNSTEPTVELTSGDANFSNYVALGNSLTAGFTDNALFIAAQENSMPNLLSQKFALAGGGTFTQPLMNDNIGGMTHPLLGTILSPRLYFDGSGPAVLPATPTTDASVNLMSSFNNCGVPGAKAGHLLFNGYAALNPYYGRMASAPNATILGDAMAQNPTFFSLWIGNNDVLGYATSGGDGTDPITDLPSFTAAYNALIANLTSNAQGVVANIPDVTTIPHFTTVPYNPVPLDAATAGALNTGYATYNGGLQFAVANSLLSQEEADKRAIMFEESSSNTMVLIDEDLTDLNAYGIPSYRQSTEDDLFVLPLSSLIPNGYGTQIPLEDKWVLTPEEQQEIADATTAFNDVIYTAHQNAGLAFVDANDLMTRLASVGVQDGDFILTNALVQGGAFSLDGVHPTARGYALLANEFMKAIDETYGSNFEESGNLYNIGEYPTNYPPSLQ